MDLRKGGITAGGLQGEFRLLIQGCKSNPPPKSLERVVPHVHGHEQLSCTFFPLHPATLESAFPAHSVTREEWRTAVVASAKLTTAEVEVWKIEPVGHFSCL